MIKKKELKNIMPGSILSAIAKGEEEYWLGL